MANIYVRSGAGGTASGASWVNACLTMAAGIAASAAGDDIWVSEDHAESAGAAKTLTFKGTSAAPNRVICANHAGTSPPVSADLAATATVTCTGAFDINLTAGIYCYGISFTTGDSGVRILGVQGVGTASKMLFQACNFGMGAVSTNKINIGGVANAGCDVEWLNTTLTCGHASQYINFQGGAFRWRNTAAAIAGATIPTTLFQTNSGVVAGTVIVDGVDLSAITGTLVGAITGRVQFQFVNCRLNASVTVAATPTSAAGATIDLVDCDSGAGNYRTERYWYSATLTTETTIVRTGGASDGVTALSRKIVTTANAKRMQPFESFPIAIWNDLTGSAKTVTLEIVNDGTTLTNADIWMEVEYLGDASYPRALLASSAPADALAAGANIPTSSVTWTTTGLGSPVKQYLQVTITPQLKGFIRAVVKVGKASKTLYIDPKLTVA